MSDYSKMTQGELIQARKDVMEKLRDANKVVKEFKDEQDAIDAAIIVTLDAAGTTRAATNVGSVSVISSEEPNADDWEALYAHIVATGDFALLHRRISATAFRELLKAGETIPGVSSRTVRSVNFRST
jgi:hypothetical protein